MGLHQIIRTFFAIIFTFLLFFLPHSSFAATVVGVKGKKILVNLQGEPALKGDIFYLLDKSGKKKALIKIMKVKGNKALALLGKGNAAKGFTLKYRPKKGESTANRPKGGESDKEDTTAESADSGGSAAGSSQMYFGVMLGFSQNSMDVELQDDAGASRGSTSLSGNGYSAKALVDYNLFSGIWFRGMFGVEQFNVSGDKLCGLSPSFNSTCTAEIMYLSLDMWGRYLFSEGSFRPWVGGGFSLMFPLTQSATALDESSITNTSVMSFGLGFDYFTSPTFYIPISVEYGLLPSSETVSANTIAIRAGAGFSF